MLPDAVSLFTSPLLDNSALGQLREGAVSRSLGKSCILY
jgi:hypothetical protein